MGIYYTVRTIFGFELDLNIVGGKTSVPSYQGCSNSNCPQSLATPFCPGCGRGMYMIEHSEINHDVDEMFFELANELPKGYVWERHTDLQNRHYIGYGISAELHQSRSLDFYKIPSEDTIRQVLEEHFSAVASHIKWGQYRVWLTAYGW